MLTQPSICFFVFDVSDTAKYNFGVGVMSQSDTFEDVLKASITGLDDDQWEQLHEETGAFNVNQMARWEPLTCRLSS